MPSGSEALGRTRNRGTTLTIVAALALLAFVSDASGQAPTPSQAVPPDTQTDTVVLSQTANTQTVQASDLRLLLSKAGLREHALIRRLIFISASLELTQPAAWKGQGPAPQTCHWAYKSFLQRQQCFVSLSGALACTEPEVIVLPEEAEGEAPPPENAQVGFCSDVFRPAVTDRARLTARLADRAAELFAADQQTRVEPAFKAAGLTVRPEPAPLPRRKP
jgi:hypothetical protein